jgi:Fe2+ transport system protein FeoA
MKLSEVREGKECRIIKIDLSDKFKKRLNELGIFEGAKVKVTKKRERAFIILSVSGVFYALREKDSNNIMVEEYE